ncbi:recQ-mediated genome instability protein 1 [Cucurbita pepo subsp. pepo]|uniref:recQ-mediated genome instability protein 1 n=1 Tax=Cucurbita pepo subsp. pepo TaxID=3664 RepID=UPI000C9D6392|nr:recQ-mediated genome instability protein 1 [Cucurbita pepo subsp. pepo]
MPRRRLRLSCSSDEDHENEDFEHDPHCPDSSATSLQPPIIDNLNSHFNPNVSEPVQLSDDDDEQDFIDVSEHLSPPSPDSDHSLRHSPEPNPHVASREPSCPVSEFLRGLGLSLNREWLDACIRAHHGSVPGFLSLNPAEKGKLCFEQFLVSDMNYAGAGVLPENVDSMHLVDLPGPYVLQVDEIVNISCPLKGRYQTSPASIKRCLKLSMTDGVQRVFGMEYRPIKGLEVLAPAGLKVVICNVTVRRGVLMLVPEAFEVLGGLVEELESARQRLVDEVNKPPRGRRTRTGVVPPLATRATHAAWPSDTVPEPVPSSRIVDAEPSRSDQGVHMFHRGNEAVTAPVSDAFTTPVSRTNANSELSTNFVSNVEEVHLHSVPSSRARTVSTIMSNSIEDTNTVNSIEGTNMVNSVEDTDMVDIEHPLILSGDREMPFTYLASLSAKWASGKEKSPSVRGKIKCFLTGVKGFQFRQRTTYDLHAYVDDGSLISEVLIDHEAVQQAIGHSPKDVTDALGSSDVKVVSGMKEALRQFQIFLVNFEGTMLVEMNRTSSLPVVLEMEEGCLESDAWLLLRRLECSNAVQTNEHARIDPIDVSP